jgi:metal-responsive CopG/Arc/MetJ family transcriptional regulator
MVKSMASKKVTVTIPEELLEEIRADATERGLSAYVAEALRAKHEQNQLRELSDWLQEEYGPLTEEELAAGRLEMAEIQAEHARRRAAEASGKAA